MPAPSLKFLKTFQIAAHRGGFAAAAAELCLTPSAVSHQVRGLEAQLGVALFRRGPRSLSLTEQGARLLAQIDPAFASLEAATADLRQLHRRVALRLQVPPFFAQELLLPRLGAFSAAHPDTDLQIATRSAPLEPHDAGMDVSITLGPGQWPGLYARALFAQTFVPACSPQLLHASGVREFADLSGASLIVHARLADLWDRWAQAAGLAPLQPRQWIRFDTMSAVVDAAERGVGFALVAAPLTQARFAAGLLTRVFAHELGAGESYYAVARAADARRGAVRELLDWLEAEFRPATPAARR
ncbi:MAG: LysR family transcriptional regulator [Gammaproteobacteria bacterium]|nr:LysR family transcriptional regulator [Gammaproteobacteria bacterium]